jgi:hypothetical protein
VVRRRLLRPALWAGSSGDRMNAPATNISDLGMDMIAEQGMPLRNTMLLLYSPKCVEEVVCSRRFAHHSGS